MKLDPLCIAIIVLQITGRLLKALKIYNYVDNLYALIAYRYYILYFLLSYFLLSILNSAPEGLEQELGFQSYLENKFSIEYLQASICPHLSVVKETILSEGDGVQTAAAAEQLQVCIKELRHRKRWIKT